MAEPSPLQFAAQAYSAASLPLDAQDCVNMYVERSPQDAKDIVPVFGCPGIAPWASLGSGPINALYVFLGNLLILAGQTLWTCPPNGAPVRVGIIGVVKRPIVSDNGVQVEFVDGSTGWIYQPGGVNFVTIGNQIAGSSTIVVDNTGAMADGDPLVITLDAGGTFATTIASVSGGTTIGLTSPLPSAVSAAAVINDANVVCTQITAPEFMPANTVTYFDSYFVTDIAGTKNFQLSGSNDGTVYSSLDTAAAESNPGTLLAVLQIHEMLSLLTTKAIETWYDAGSLDFPFARFDGGTIQRGIAAPQALVAEDNTFFWLGDDIVFYRLQGFTPQRISQHAVEQAWKKYGTVADAFCMAHTWNGHKFITISFPSAGATWTYDVATQLWHRRVSWNAQNQDIGGWRVNCIVNWNNLVIAGDRLSGQIGYVNDQTYTEFGAIMPALITSPPVHAARARLFWTLFELDVETGVGLTSGQGSVPVWMLDWSDDGARTWSRTQPWRSMGAIGEYKTRLRWTRMGQARQRTLRLRCTDPVRRAIIGTYAATHEGLP
jgi:hypothetical protein